MPLIIVLFDKVVTLETFNELVKVALLFNIVVPDTFKLLYTKTLLLVFILIAVLLFELFNIKICVC